MRSRVWTFMVSIFSATHNLSQKCKCMTSCTQLQCSDFLCPEYAQRQFAKIVDTHGSWHLRDRYNFWIDQNTKRIQQVFLKMRYLKIQRVLVFHMNIIVLYSSQVYSKRTFLQNPPKRLSRHRMILSGRWSSEDRHWLPLTRTGVYSCSRRFQKSSVFTSRKVENRNVAFAKICQGNPMES